MALAKTLLLLLIATTISKADLEFQAHRLIEYQTAEGELFGSLSTSLNFPAAHYSGDIFRKVALIKFNDILSATDANSLVEEVFKKNPLGVLFIIPPTLGRNKNSQNLKAWEDIQLKLSTQKIDIPVYFSHETQELFELYKDLSEQAALKQSVAPQKGFGRMLSTQAEHILFLNANEPKLLSSINLDVIYGQINFNDDQTEQNPIIAVSASYDALSISPDLSFGIEASGSSVIAALQVSKIFSQLQSEIQQQLGQQTGNGKSKFKYDLLLVLTPTSSLNHEATSKFIDHLQSNIKERIRLVVSLDQFVSGPSSDNALYLFNSGSEDELAQQFAAELQKAAVQRGIRVDVSDGPVQKKSFIQYEHTIYQEKSISAVTVTAKDNSQLTHRFQKYSVFDTELDTPVQLRRNILVLSEALVKLIFNFQDRSVNFFVDNDSLVSLDFIKQLTSFLKANPRAPHMIQRDSPVSKEFNRILGLNVNGVKRMGVIVKDTQFYEDKADMKIQVNLVTSKLIELYIFFGILGYLITLYFGIQKFNPQASDGDKKKNE